MRVVLSPSSLHDLRDLGCERVVKATAAWEAYLIPHR